MTVSKARKNAFAGITTEGADEARYRHTSGRDTTVETLPTSSKPTDVLPTAEPVRNKGGRPKNEIQRKKTVLYLNPVNVLAMKTHAVKFDARFSDVIDALIQYHLNDLTDDELLAVKNINKTKIS